MAFRNPRRYVVRENIYGPGTYKPPSPEERERNREFNKRVAEKQAWGKFKSGCSNVFAFIFLLFIVSVVLQECSKRAKNKENSRQDPQTNAPAERSSLSPEPSPMVNHDLGRVENEGSESRILQAQVEDKGFAARIAVRGRHVRIARVNIQTAKGNGVSRMLHLREATR